ncbi:amidase [Methyloligella sp. 2.7D]|uniref:amidase n=1 Tax=unclassified Methyloligella TaxID=2625955 RepID=UPI00157C4F17|nr:amidase [Methyloligella sp. GL2]QKP77236.1 amidase [Methyloligella sp. GL2]
MQSASEIREAILVGETSCEAVVSAALERAKPVQERLNAFTILLDEEALAAARWIDGSGAPADAGLLHGVPIVIKDMTPTAGHPTTLGSLTTGEGITDHDAVIVQRLKAQGAIVIGKTTTPEFAFSSFTRSPRYGPTRNPWDTSRTPGGSSGGSAVAVATGVVPLGEGTDMGGSVRIPAGASGVVGFKPSLGRTPMSILPTGVDTISHFGPLASCVADAALFVAAGAGGHPADLLSQTRDFRLADTAPAPLQGLRFALSHDLGYCAVQPEVSDALQNTADELARAGAEIVEVDLPWTRAVYDEWIKHWNALLALFPTGQTPEQRAQMDPTLAACIEEGRALSALDLMRVGILRKEMSLQLGAILESCDALLCPTNAVEAPPVDAPETDYEADTEDGKFCAFDMTHPFNMLSNLPVLSLPIGLTPSGLPMGMQIVGRPYQDERLLAIAGGIEAMRGPFPAPPNFQPSPFQR